MRISNGVPFVIDGAGGGQTPLLDFDAQDYDTGIRPPAGFRSGQIVRRPRGARRRHAPASDELSGHFRRLADGVSDAGTSVVAMSLELRPPRPATADAVQLDPSQRAVLRLPDAHVRRRHRRSRVGQDHGAHRARRAAPPRAGRGRPPTLLVLAASRQSATALRDRLGLRVGIPTTGPLARTIVSAAYSVARSEAVRMGREAPRLLTGGEQDAIVADLLEGNEADGTGPVWPPTLPAEVRALPAFRTELRELIGAHAPSWLIDRPPSSPGSGGHSITPSGSPPRVRRPVPGRARPGPRDLARLRRSARRGRPPPSSPAMNRPSRGWWWSTTARS